METRTYSHLKAAFLAKRPSFSQKKGEIRNPCSIIIIIIIILRLNIGGKN